MDKEISKRTLNLRGPSESYIDFLLVPQDRKVVPKNLREIFSVAEPERLKFFSSSNQALRSALQSHLNGVASGKFIYTGPKNFELEKLLSGTFGSLDIECAGSDPEALLKQRFPTKTFLLIQSPNSLDSSFWSKELMARVAQHVLQDSSAYVLVDETLSSLAWEGSEDLGALRHISVDRIGTLLSLEPWNLAKTKLTLLQRAPSTQIMDDLSIESPEMEDWPLLLMLWQREFHRGAQHLRLRTALKRSARLFTEGIRPLLDRKILRCEHWPLAGHSLQLLSNQISEMELQKKLRAAELSIATDTVGEDVRLNLVLPVDADWTQECAKRLQAIFKT